MCHLHWLSHIIPCTVNQCINIYYGVTKFKTDQLKIKHTYILFLQSYESSLSDFKLITVVTVLNQLDIIVLFSALEEWHDHQ